MGREHRYNFFQEKSGLKMRRRQPQISDDAVTKLNIGWKSAFHSPDICRVHACRQGFGHGYGSGAMWQL